MRCSAFFFAHVLRTYAITRDVRNVAGRAKDGVRACIENLRQQKLLARGAGQGGAWGPGCTYSRVLRHP